MSLCYTWFWIFYKRAQILKTLANRESGKRTINLIKECFTSIVLILIPFYRQFSTFQNEKSIWTEKQNFTFRNSETGYFNNLKTFFHHIFLMRILKTNPASQTVLLLLINISSKMFHWKIPNQVKWQRRWSSR